MNMQLNKKRIRQLNNNEFNIKTAQALYNAIKYYINNTTKEG